MIRRSYDGNQNPNFKDGGCKICINCNATYKNYNKKSKYCSNKCYVDNQKKRIVDQALEAARQPRKPKAKLGYNLVCVVCGINFRAIQRSKYCSSHKAEAAINKVAKIRIPQPKDPDKKEKKVCLQCKKEFEHYKSRQKVYCSYQCHLDSGGAWRAGMAASKATMKYGAKKDANHHEVVDALRKAGASIVDMSHVGKGFPDLIVGFQSKTILMEIKNPKTSYGKKGLNKNQVKWKEQWLGGAYCTVDSPEAALQMIGMMSDSSPV